MEVCVLSLPDSGVVEEVVLGEGGLLEGLSEGDVVVDTSSSRPSSTREVARRLAAEGHRDARRPGQRGLVAGRGRRAGGDGWRGPGLFEECRAVLEAFSGEIFYVGESGAGTWRRP